MYFLIPIGEWKSFERRLGATLVCLEIMELAKNSNFIIGKFSTDREIKKKLGNKCPICGSNNAIELEVDNLPLLKEGSELFVVTIIDQSKSLWCTSCKNFEITNISFDGPFKNKKEAKEYYIFNPEVVYGKWLYNSAKVGSIVGIVAAIVFSIYFREPMSLIGLIPALLLAGLLIGALIGAIVGSLINHINKKRRELKDC